MVTIQNYIAFLFVVPFYGGLVFLIVVPPPLGLYIFGFFAILSVVLVGGTPTYASIHTKNFKQAWIQPSNDEVFVESTKTNWIYPGRFQLWYKGNPRHMWLEESKEWLTEIPLDKPYAHPIYNAGRKCLYFFFVLHSIEDIVKSELLYGIDEDEKKEMGRWEYLSPKHGGWVTYLGYLLKNPSSDWFDVDEVMPAHEFLAEETNARGNGKEEEDFVTQIVDNHIPLVVNNKAHPMYRITNCGNAYNIRKQLKERQQAQTIKVTTQ